MRTKFSFVTAIAAAIFCLASCGSDDSSTPGPAFAWEGDNISGSKVEILSGSEVNLKVQAEAGISSLQLMVTLPNASFASIINSYITNSGNQVAMDGKSNTCILDLCNDSKSYGLLVGSSAKGKTQTLIRFSKLFDELIPDNANITSELNFHFVVNATDDNGKLSNSQLTFHWTPAPSVVWTGVTNGSSDLTSSPKTSFAIEAPAGIEGFKISVSSSCEEFNQYLRIMGGTASGNSIVLNLLDGAKNESLGFPSASSLKNSKKLTLDLSQVIGYLKEANGREGSHRFTFDLTDSYGKQTTFVAVYYAN